MKKNFFSSRKKQVIPPPSRKSIFDPDDAMKGKNNFQAGEVTASSEPQYPKVSFDTKIETSPELVEPPISSSKHYQPVRKKSIRSDRFEKTIKMDVSSFKFHNKNNKKSDWSVFFIIISIIFTTLLLTGVIILLLQ